MEPIIIVSSDSTNCDVDVDDSNFHHFMSKDEWELLKLPNSDVMILRSGRVIKKVNV
jgi:hypothetical protein